MVRPVASLLMLALCVAGCGDSSTSDTAPSAATRSAPTTTQTTTKQPTRTQPTTHSPKPKPRTGARKFTGIGRDNYEQAKAVCGAFSVRKAARDLGIESSNPVTVAERYARAYRPGLRQAVFEGCLAAFKAR